MALRSARGVVGQQHAQRAFEFAGAPIGQRFLALRVGHDGRAEGVEGAVRTGHASELQVVADVADLVDEHGAAVEPPRAVQAVKGVLVMPGDDHLAAADRAWPA